MAQPSGAQQPAVQEVDTAGGLSYPYVQVLTLAQANTGQPLQMGRIKRGVIRNLSATDTVFIYNQRNPPPKPALGIPLNPAPNAGQGGDALVLGNVDTTDLYWIAATAGDQIAVYWEA